MSVDQSVDSPNRNREIPTYNDTKTRVINTATQSCMCTVNCKPKLWQYRTT